MPNPMIFDNAGVTQSAEAISIRPTRAPALRRWAIGLSFGAALLAMQVATALASVPGLPEGPGGGC